MKLFNASRSADRAALSGRRRWLALFAVLLLSGCVAAPSTSGAELQVVTSCLESRPHQVEIGLGVANTTNAQRAAVLDSLFHDLNSAIGPGRAAVEVNLYPLSQNSFIAEPARLSLACVPPALQRPDLTNTLPQDRAARDRKYQESMDRTRNLLIANERQLKDFRPRIDRLTLRQVPIDIWGWLRAVTTDFERADALDRTVIIIAADEGGNAESAFCDGCASLHNARVLFLNFTHSTPEIDTRRRDEWELWLRLVGASTVQFFRPGQPVDGVLVAGWN